MWAVLGTALTALASPPTQPQNGPPPAPPVHMTVQKQTAPKKVEIFTPLTTKRASQQTDKVVHVDGMSSQPWSRTIGTKPGWSAFPDAEHQQSTLNLFWIGAAPSR